MNDVPHLIRRLAFWIGLLAVLGVVWTMAEEAGLNYLESVHQQGSLAYDLLGLADMPYGVSLVLVGVTAFFGFTCICESVGGEYALVKGGMRLSITVAIVTVYLVLIAYVVPFRTVQALPPIVSMMLTSFTTVVGIVIAAYFGTSAYVQSRQKPGPESSRDAVETTDLGQP